MGLGGAGLDRAWLCVRVCARVGSPFVLRPLGCEHMQDVCEALIVPRVGIVHALAKQGLRISMGMFMGMAQAQASSK